MKIAMSGLLGEGVVCEVSVVRCCVSKLWNMWVTRYNTDVNHRRCTGGPQSLYKCEKCEVNTRGNEMVAA